jgi:hypothetical protein
MSTHAQLEARLTAVETALREIQRRLATLPPAPNWLNEMIGSFKDEPAFDEVIALGRAFRRGESSPADAGAPAARRLAAAVVCLVDAIHQAFPTVSIRPLPPYEDEDFTLEIWIPAGMDRETVRNACIRQALTIEEQFGFIILPRVKVAPTSEATA